MSSCSGRAPKLGAVHGICVGVRERVEALAGRPGAAAVFGASGHRFRLDAPLTQAQLVAWETRVGATLPAEYRSFLTQVAASGAGPHYGLLGFRVTDRRALGRRHVARAGTAQPAGRVSSPGCVPVGPVAAIRRDPATRAVRDPGRSRRGRASSGRTDAGAGGPRRGRHGTIPLSHQGCGYYDLPVVNGPDAGHVWLDDRACDGPISPQVDDTDRITFNRWYLTWLEQAEATGAGHAMT